MAKGWLIAAPASGAGKTTVTLGILRALTRRGVSVAPFKSGPDYIDPRFHEAAAGATSRNLDAWAMDAARLAAVYGRGSGLPIVEAAMGLFDGAANGSGSAAQLARELDLDVVLVIDCARQSHSVAALVHGFATFDATVRVRHVVLNNVGSERHERMLRSALPDGLVLGALKRDPALGLPDRHLGLVQAEEIDALKAFIDRAADAVETGLDLTAFAATSPTSTPQTSTDGAARLEPLGQTIAVARDKAFSFVYPHMMEDWRASGATIVPFSPLADEEPASDADAVFLPGGYPELHAGRIGSAETFARGMGAAAARGATIYGECGGYMVLGQGMVDADGAQHAMLGMLDVETSFQTRRRVLGYRRFTTKAATLMGGRSFTGHEYHHCTATRERGERLFDMEDTTGTALGEAGLRNGTVMGSWLHVIDRHPA